MAVVSKNGIIFNIEGWADPRSGLSVDDGLIPDNTRIRVRLINQLNCHLPRVAEGASYTEISIPALEFEKFLMQYIEDNK